MLAPVPRLPVSYLAANAERRPDAPAVIDTERTLSFAALRDVVIGAASRLPAAGMRLGVPVAVQLPNVWE
ncbi:MAG TPA: AMP-binding protein, partial [Solirubrobacterales bacterium]